MKFNLEIRARQRYVNVLGQLIDLFRRRMNNVNYFMIYLYCAQPVCTKNVRYCFFFFHILLITVMVYRKYEYII